MAHIRPYRSGDEPALSDVCVRTGDAGGDATGRYSSDDLVGAIFVLPYVVHHPDHAWVVETDDGRVAGYIVGAPDTDSFDKWFRDEWWPKYHGQFPQPRSVLTEEDEIVDGAYRRAERASEAGEQGCGFGSTGCQSEEIASASLFEDIRHTSFPSFFFLQMR